MATITTGTAQGLYTQLCSQRQTYLERARDASRLTIPTLVPDEGDTTAKRFPTPYQSVGARGVNNLASALLLSLLPPNAPFFRLVLDDKAKMEMDQIDPTIKNQIDHAMSRIERSVMSEIETSGVRISVFEAVKQLIVAGNVLFYIPDKGNVRVFRLDRYVVTRNPDGTPDKIVIRECMSPDSLPEGIRDYVAGNMAANEKVVDLYTCVKYMPDGKVHVFQEVQGQVIPESEGIFPANQSPYIPLRMMRVDGEDYGRGYVEQFFGDLKSLEALSQAIVEGSAASAKVLFLVNPNGTTRAKTLSESPNGAIREGTANDVSVLQVQKHADFSVALQTMSKIEERLSYAFLLTESTIRNAERVTAEEVRLVTQSIERQLGGIYSVLSQEFQLPMVHRLMYRMERGKRLPKIPKDMVKPAIVTGIDALGRGNDLNKLDVYLAGIGQTLGPEVLQQYINIREYLDRRAAALGIDAEGLVKSEEQIAQEQQAQQQAMMMQQAAQTMGPGAMGIAREQVKQQGEQQ